MDGHHVLMFGSNAYTGLTGDERIIAKAKEALDKYGSGCAGSRFLNGTLDLHEQLEKELAEFVHKEGSMCFSTGFSVNQGVIPALLGKDDYVICDDGIYMLAYRRRNSTLLHLSFEMDTLRSNCKTRRSAASASSSPMACSQWKATSAICPQSLS